MSKITREKCAEIIQEFEPSTEAKLFGHLGIDGMFQKKIFLINIFYHLNVIYLIQIIVVFVKKWIIHSIIIL
jgi:hypothetical protein